MSLDNAAKSSQFNEDLIEKYNEESNEGYFREVNIQHPKKLYEVTMTYHFHQKE